MRFWTDLKAIWSSILINMDKETKRRGWIFEKTFKLLCFQFFESGWGKFSWMVTIAWICHCGGEDKIKAGRAQK